MNEPLATDENGQPITREGRIGTLYKIESDRKYPWISERAAKPKLRRLRSEENEPTKAKVEEAAAKIRRAGRAKPGRSRRLARNLLLAGMDVDEFCNSAPKPKRRKANKDSFRRASGSTEEEGFIGVRSAAHLLQTRYGGFGQASHHFSGVQRYDVEGKPSEDGPRIKMSDFHKAEERVKQERHRRNVEKLAKSKGSARKGGSVALNRIGGR